MTIELDPGTSYVVGRDELARRYRKGQRWARELLREWWREQQEGGPVRVFRRRTKTGASRVSYFTTTTVLLRDMPPGRDEAVWRKIKEQGEAIEWLTKRLGEESSRLRTLEARYAALESKVGKLRLR
jgi:hypothetical protein